MSDKTEADILLHFCTAERREKLFVAVQELFALINLVYFQTPYGDWKNGGLKL